MGRSRALLSPALLLGLGVFGLYVATLAPTVLRSDSGEFHVMPWVLGVAHAPGYPLLTLLGRLAMLLPVGDPAYRVNLLEAGLAAAAAACTYLAVLELVAGPPAARTRPRTLAAHVGGAAGGLALALGATYWQQSLVGGPRPPSFLFTALLLWLLIRWGHRRRTRDLVALAAAAGLSVAHHPNSALLFPALAIYLLGRDPRLPLRGRQLAPAALAFLLPLGLYAYLPIRSAMDPPLGATNLADPRELLLYVTATHYQDTVLVNCAGQELLQVRRYLVFLGLQFGPWLPLFGLLGLLATLVRAPLAGLALLYAFFSNAFFGICSRLAMPEYIIPSYVVAAMWIGLAMFLVSGFWFLVSSFWFRVSRPISKPETRTQKLETPNSKLLSLRNAPALLVLGLVLGVAAYRVVTGLPYQDMTGRFADAERARRGMAQARPEAVVLSDWESITPLWYAQRVEGLGQGTKTAMVTAAPRSPAWLVASQTALEDRPVSLAQRVPALGEQYKLLPVGTLFDVQERLVVERANVGLLTDGRALRLLGHALDRPFAAPGEVVQLTLYQVAGRNNETPYRPLLRLASDPPVEFHFSMALQVPSDRWGNDEMVGQVFTFSLPEWLPPGPLGLEVAYQELGKDDLVALAGGAPWARVGELTVTPLPSATLPTPDSALASFANQLALRSGRVSSGGASSDLARSGTLEARRGERLEAELRWTGLRWMDESYTLFVHLLDRDGRLVAQWDGLPLGGVYHTYKWVPGQTIQDWVTLTLPGDLAPGPHTLTIGAYHSVTTARLPLLDRWGGSRSDAFEWGTIEVR